MPGPPEFLDVPVASELDVAQALIEVGGISSHAGRVIRMLAAERDSLRALRPRDGSSEYVKLDRPKLGQGKSLDQAP